MIRGLLPSTVVFTAVSQIRACVLRAGRRYVLYTTSTYCEVCPGFEYIQRRAAHLLRHEPIKIGVVDCQRHAQLCKNIDVTQFPTVLLFLYSAVNTSLPTIVQGRPLLQDDHAMGIFNMPNRKVVNIPPLGVGATVSWIRHYLPRIETDGHVTEVLASFYDRFDPGTKSSYELEAIASK